jgi:dUTP pyrophosphatase
MSKVGVQIVYLPHYAGSQKMGYKHDGDSGMDLYASFEEEYIMLGPGERLLVPSGVKMVCDQGKELQVRPRGGTALNRGLTVANTPGTIDSNFRGEAKIIAINLSNNTIKIERGERIAQIVLCPVYEMELVEVEELDQTSRGEGAYNSTGTK